MKRRFSRGRLLAVVLWPLLVTVVHAEKGLQPGINAINAGQYEDAFKDFQAAEKADPSDSNALFFQGMALNRLGRYSEALEVLQRAAKAGNRNRDLAFEGAWSHLHLGHAEKAIKLLMLYEKIYPGRGQTSEFLGRAYAMLGDYKKSEAELKEATRRDPELHPSADLLAASENVEQKNTAQARANLLATLRQEKDTPLGRSLVPATVGSTTPSKPWSISLSTGAGYNSNVSNQGTGFPLSKGVAYKGAAFGEFAVDGNYRWDLTPHDTVKAGYDLQSDIYDGASAIDMNDHFWHADYNHDWNNTTAASVRVSDEYTTYGGNSFRNQFSTRAAVGERLATWDTMEASYTYGMGSYYFTLPPADNRSGNLHALSLSNYALVPGTPLSLSLSYYHTFNDAQGSDFSSDNDGLIFSAASPLIWKITGAFYYNIEFDDYRHPNTFGAAGQSRSDEIDTATVEFTRPIVENMKAYVRYSFTSDDSNLAFFNYEQHIVSGGLIVQF